jgi:hypothetical protein
MNTVNERYELVQRYRLFFVAITLPWQRALLSKLFLASSTQTNEPVVGRKHNASLMKL